MTEHTHKIVSESLASRCEPKFYNKRSSGTVIRVLRGTVIGP